MTPVQGHRGKAYIASLGTSTPSLRIDQKKGGLILTEHYSDTLKPRSINLLRKLSAHPSIAHRYFAVDNPETLFTEDPDSRIARFTEWSVRLSSDAVMQAIKEVKVGVGDIRGIIVNTCTGYICPGISTYLIENLGLRRDVRTYDLVGSGCAGAVPNLQLAEALAQQTPEGVIVSVSSEICSATFQMSDDLSLLVSNTLFGDGAAAAVISKKPGALEIVDTQNIIVPEEREYIRYIHKNGELHNQLSMDLDAHVKKAVAHVVDTLLSRWSLRGADIAHWALHTGGEKIINGIKEELGLAEEQLIATRSVLRDYGNMSSPTVLFVLKKLFDRGIKEGEWCVMVAFGAGLSAYACLLRKS